MKICNPESRDTVVPEGLPCLFPSGEIQAGQAGDKVNEVFRDPLTSQLRAEAEQLMEGCTCSLTEDRNQS